MVDWQTQRDARDRRQQARDELRRLRIEWQDKLWLAQTHPCSDSVLAWLSENRAEASKIGASRWHLETLPALVAAQERLRMAERFEAVLERARVSHQTLTVQDVLGDSPQIPQNQSVETGNAAPSGRRPRRDAGKARKRSR